MPSNSKHSHQSMAPLAHKNKSLSLLFALLCQSPSGEEKNPDLH